jgi:hypothetical protein
VLKVEQTLSNIEGSNEMTDGFGGRFRVGDFRVLVLTFNFISELRVDQRKSERECGLQTESKEHVRDEEHTADLG